MATEKRDESSKVTEGRDVYKKDGGDRGPTHRLSRSMTDLIVGVSGAMADGSRTFSDTVRKRARPERVDTNCTTGQVPTLAP